MICIIERPSRPAVPLHQIARSAQTGRGSGWALAAGSPCRRRWEMAVPQVVTSEIGDTWVHGTASDPSRARRCDRNAPLPPERPTPTDP